MTPDIRAVHELRAARGIAAARSASAPMRFRWPKRAKGFVPVFATGGVGDAFVTIAVCRAIAMKTNLNVKLYIPQVRVAEWIIEKTLERMRAESPFPKDRVTSSVEVCFDPFPGYDFYLHVNCLGIIRQERNFKGFPVKALDAMYMKHFLWRHGETWSRLVDFHPFLDGEVAHQAIAAGETRHSLPFRMLGLEPTYLNLRPMTPKFDWEPYVTVHDGYDVTQRPVHRATKTWGIRQWAEFVRGLKAAHPELMVVQIGGPTSRAIPGVDVDLVGKTTIRQALDVLSRSKLHIDGDSGFVHGATAMGVPCVAMFGPTPAKFFGYPENENLQDDGCQSCFWTKNDWLEKCPIGHPSPLCMDRITVDKVIKSTERFLNGKV